MAADYAASSAGEQAALVVASNIAKGSERGSDRDFRRFPSIAQASNAEVEIQVIIAGDIGIMNSLTAAAILATTETIGPMITRLVMSPNTSG